MNSIFQSQVVFWDSWKKFEVKHGNEDTVREMLRIKRSVQATYNTQVNFMATKVLTTQGISLIYHSLLRVLAASWFTSPRVMPMTTLHSSLLVSFSYIC